MPGLLDKPLVFVVGKGGVGRSTVAAALGLVAAARGRRAIVAEVAGQDRAARLLAPRARDPFAEHRVEKGLWTISVDPQHATREYLADQLPVRAMADLLSSSDTFAYFAAAAPGLHELVTIGKIWELAQSERRTPGAEPYDVVIVDAPASGHALALMRTPKTFADIARVGPIARQARHIAGFVGDPRQTGVLGVALPAEMPVTETVALDQALRREVGLGMDGVILNGVYPPRFTRADAKALKARNGSRMTGDPVGPASPDGEPTEVPCGPLARAAVRAALSEDTRARAQRALAKRLAEEVGGAETVELPYLFRADLGRAGIDELAERLERAA